MIRSFAEVSRCSVISHCKPGKELTRGRDVVPPRAEERIISPCYLLRQHVDTFVIERRKSTEKSVENASEGPHVDGLGVPFVLYDLWCCVPNSSAWGHGLLVPDDLGETEVGEFDSADAPSSKALSELALVFLLFIIWSVRSLLRRDYRDPLKEDVLRLDVATI